MTERKVVSPSQLNAWLTDQIQKVDGCNHCKLTWKYRLQEPEKHGGRNWSELNLRLGEGTDYDPAVKAALAIERAASEQFQLEEEPPRPAPAGPKVKTNLLPRLLHGPTFHPMRTSSTRARSSTLSIAWSIGGTKALSCL